MPKKKEAVEVVEGSPDPSPASIPVCVHGVPSPEGVCAHRIRNEQPAEERVPFKSWFIMKLKVESRLQAHHAEALFVYFAGRGLQEMDSARKFDAALREYFGS